MLKVVAALNAFYYLCNALSIQDGSALIISILHTPTIHESSQPVSLILSLSRLCVTSLHLFALFPGTA